MMSRTLLISVLLVLIMITASCAKRNTAYADGNHLELIKTIPVIGNPSHISVGGDWVYVALDQGGLGVVNTQNYSYKWLTSLTSADGSVTQLTRIRLVDSVPNRDILYIYDTSGTDDISFISTSVSDSLKPFGSIRGASQNIQDMIWNNLEADPESNIVELLYSTSTEVYYGRNDGGFWMGSDFNIPVAYPIQGLGMDDNNIYVAVDQRGLFTYSRASQQLLSEISFYGYAQNMAVHDNIVYVAARHGGLQIVDVSNPAQPVLLAGYDTDGYASDIDYHDGKVAVSSGGGGVYLFDVSSPANPKLLAHITDCGYANTVAFSESSLVVASRDHGIMFYAIN
ncbi:MAG: hypothetical protein PHY98_03315 [Candidatus Cloacimonetes bacterium]|nr:hypothetical protein [Candidatus Cloacimonadota bacterium]